MRNEIKREAMDVIWNDDAPTIPDGFRAIVAGNDVKISHPPKDIRATTPPHPPANCHLLPVDTEPGEKNNRQRAPAASFPNQFRDRNTKPKASPTST